MSGMEVMRAEEERAANPGYGYGYGGGFGYHPYPAALATYEQVVASPHLFMDILKKLHASMGTKFMIPVVGGRDLDLHKLFVEVTSRGGIAKVVKDRKWKEVTCVFEFPSSATNASFILRKYYVSLLYHCEQIYFFKAKCWTPSPTAAVSAPPSLSYTTTNTATTTGTTHAHQPSPQFTPDTAPPQGGSQVCGVIDGKFDGGYLITVRLGSDELKGVLYQVPESEQQGAFPASIHARAGAGAGTPRRKRRKKSEIRRRDPAHPKPNRSGYNFFFAEQHAKLKPLYHGKDREISRIIGESWNKLEEHQRAVYQEKAFKDKERYKMEMEGYRETLRLGQISQTATPAPAPAQQLAAVANLQASAAYIDENEVSSDKSNLEEYESSREKVEGGSDLGECSQGDMNLKNVNVEMMADEEAFDLQRQPEPQPQPQKVGWDDDYTSRGMCNVDQNRMWWSAEKNVVSGEGGISVRIQEGEQLP